jgi:Protein of unknown function/Domain of unknown function (DUF1835)
MNDVPTLHVVFSDSGARLLRPVLRKVDPAGRVLAFPDDLSFGPIDPPEPQLRLDWMRQALGAPAKDWDWLPAKTNAFWSIALSHPGRIVAWVSRRTAMEHAGFLEWIWRLGERRFDLVDLTDVDTAWELPDGTVRTGRVISLGLLDPDQIQIHRFLSHAQVLPSSLRDRYHGMWRQLRGENAALRILRNERLQSAPITHFDTLAYACASERWLTIERVVGQALVEAWDDDGIQTSDVVLAARMRALVDAGQLECRGDPVDWRKCEIRIAIPQRQR